jgi:outer membrane lipoprotein-sorting protein
MVTAVALVGGGAAFKGIQAAADQGLPARSAAQLLVDVQKARLDGISGTVVQKSDLGLPSLPSTGGSGGAASSDLTSMLSGEHTSRVWFAGPDKARMALLGTLGESDVIRNGPDLWVWASKEKTAKHYVLPTHDAAGKKANRGKNDTAGVPGPSDLPTSPQAAAEKALAAISPSTTVTTNGTAKVAERSAYELVLTPKEPTSLVAQVRVAIDGIRHVPLRVQVYAKSVPDPVFEVAFSAVDFGRPDAAQFTFKAPPGTKVTEEKVAAHQKPGAGAKTGAPNAGGPKAVGPQGGSADAPKVIGKGWGSVLVVKMPVPSTKAGGGTGANADRNLAQLTRFIALLPKVKGSWGTGHLMAGTVFSALLTDDGRLVVGAVTPDALYAGLAAS